MSHYAKIENNIVTQVIVAHSKAWCEDALGGEWVQTSYNTRGGIHYGQDGQPDGGVALNKNYAGVGFSWDGTGFSAPQPYPSWILNDKCQWEAPKPMPTDGLYSWHEDTQSWVKID